MKQLLDFCILSCCSDMLLSRTHKIPFAVIQWKRTFASQHASGLKNVTIYQVQLSQSHWLNMSRTEITIGDHTAHRYHDKECLITWDRQLLFMEILNTIIWCHSWNNF